MTILARCAMPNCKSIPPEAWAHAREALLRYFASRHGCQDAEDLAQQTLTKLWERQDYEFKSDSDFLKVCLGFARNVSFEDFRSNRRTHEALEFDPAAAVHAADGPRAIESRILLSEICGIGAERLKWKEWNVLRKAVADAEASPQVILRPAESNRDRVYLHRIRQKLRGMTGWRKNRV